MNLYLIKVHQRSPDTTVTTIHQVNEYEVRAPDLSEACAKVVDMPTRSGEGFERMYRQSPYTRDYVEPDRSRFHAVAEFTQGDPASVERALASSATEVAERARMAREVALHYGETDRSNILDCVTLVDSWDDRDADHAALLKHFADNEWVDEEGKGHTWHTPLHEKLAKAGIDGPAERAVAEETYWEVVREEVAKADAERDAAPAGP